jgi:hypothetical protein
MGLGSEIRDPEKNLFRIRNTGIQSTAHPLSQMSPLHTVPPFMLSADFSQLHSVSFGNFMHLH